MGTKTKVISIGALAAAIVAMGGAWSLGSGMFVTAFGQPPYLSRAEGLQFAQMAQYSYLEALYNKRDRLLYLIAQQQQKQRVQQFAYGPDRDQLLYWQRDLEQTQREIQRVEQQQRR